MISVTQILGTDSIAGSRITINNNFSVLKDAINTLETFLNPNVSGGDLNIGNIVIKKLSNPVTSTLLNCEASALIQGNFNVNLDSVFNGNANINGLLTSDKGVEVTGNSTSPYVKFGSINKIDLSYTNVRFIDEEFSTTVPLQVHLENPASSGVYELDVTNLRVVYLDYSAYTGASGQTDTLKLIGTPSLGQVLFIRIVNAPSTGGTFKISNTSLLDSIYTSTIDFVGSDPSELKKLFIELVYTPSGFVVKNAHKNVNNI